LYENFTHFVVEYFVQRFVEMLLDKLL